MFNIFKNKNTKILSPCKGFINNLETSSDPVFASKVLGEGLYIEPTENILLAPVSGMIASIFPTKHALGIITESGIEVLIHIGIDTANLNGKYFNCFVKQGQKIIKGDPLIEVDFDKIKLHSYVTDVYIMVTNSDNYEIELIDDQQHVSAEQLIMTIK